MSDIKTRADSLRIYHTGAASDGAVQADQTLSLGGYRAGDEAQPNDLAIGDAVFGVVIASAAMTAGAAILAAPTTGTIALKRPGGTAYGPAVTIADGETKVIESDTPGQFIRATRSSAVDLAGASSLAVTLRRNNVYGMSDVPDASATSGSTTYRAIILKNESLLNVTSVILSLSGGSGYAAGADPAGVLAAGSPIQTIPNENTAPVGVFFEPGTLFQVPIATTITPGKLIGLWFKRVVAPGAVAKAAASVTGVLYFATGGTTFGINFGGVHRIENAALAGYVAWVGVNAAPDLSNAPDVTSTALPMALAVTPPLTGTADLYVVARQ